MRLRTQLLFFLLLFLSLKARGAVFTVTSNGDAGPGTLRDAMTQATTNGSAVKDLIVFNLPDLTEAGRTITLVSQLPDLSSNLVIDGTTQAGTPFGKSNVFIKIATPHNYIAITTFKGTGLNDVEFYGLYIYDYTGDYESRPDLQARPGINISQSSNIIIGSAGKGNMIRGFNISSLNLSNVNFVTLQNSVIGIGKNNDFNDDETNSEYDYTPPVTLYKCNNITIGGNANEGNLFFTAVNLVFAQKTTGNNIAVKSNLFGVFQDGKTISFMFQEGTLINLSTENVAYTGPADFDSSVLATVNMDIENNVAGSFGNAFILNTVGGAINFYNNYLGISKDGSTNLELNSHPNDGAPIAFHYCTAQITVGGDDPTKKNFLANCVSAIVTENASNIFIRNNDYECISSNVYNSYNSKPLPALTINKVATNNTQTTISGTADPGATIDIYSSESCDFAKCSIRTYVETTPADNTGNWRSSPLNFSGIFYASASINKRTSAFKTFEINTQNMVITNLRCNTQASVTGLQVPAGLPYYWIDDKGNVVSRDLDLRTGTPGTYQLVLGNGCIISAPFQLNDDRVAVYDNGLTKIDISCGANTGAIKGLFIYDPLFEIISETWTDESGKVVGTGTDIENLSAGRYFLTVKTSDGCTINYGPVVLKNTTSLNIDQSKSVVQATNCGQSIGSITGITASGNGTLVYSWKNASQQQVGNTADLTGQPAGQYTLQVTDNTQCGAVYSTVVQITEINGITLDESKVQTTAATCSNNNGTVTGIQVSGATQYQWIDADNKVVATAANLLAAPPGDYTLTASNTFGCSKTSKTYHIDLLPLTIYPSYNVAIQNPCSGQNNGSVSVSFDAVVKAARWVNGQGQTVTTGNQASNLPAGSYQLYLTDQNGCETLYKDYVVAGVPQLQLVNGSEEITDDQCTLKTGSIKNIQVTGGVPPYTYQWTDASNNIVSTSADLTAANVGDYTLLVNDSRNCNGPVSSTYHVQNQGNDIPLPVVNNMQLCSPGDVLVKVGNPQTIYSYHLYSSIFLFNKRCAGGYPVDRNFQAECAS